MAGSGKTMKGKLDKQGRRRSNIFDVLRSPNYVSFYFLFLIFGLCVVSYYFGELVDFAGWKDLRWEIFYTVHDVHRLLFLVPIVYAAYVFGMKATMIMTTLTLAAFFPRALFVSPYPDPVARMLIFIVTEGAMGYLVAKNRRENRRIKRLEVILRTERDKLQGILDRMEDGVMLIGPDYKIRYMNPSIARNFNTGIGSYCYQCIQKIDVPCPQICKLPSVIGGAVAKWIYNTADGKSYEVVNSPFIDTDGTVCQLATFRLISGRVVI